MATKPEMTHTPGPWFNAGFVGTVGSYVVGSEQGRFVASCAGPPDSAQCNADAHLIAASPDLLAACRALVAAIDPPMFKGKGKRAATTHIESFFIEPLRLAREAIAKAEGR